MATVTLSASSSTITYGGSVTITATYSGSNGNMTISWSGAATGSDYFTFSQVRGSKDVTITPTTAGTLSVSVTYRNSSMTVLDTDSISVTVNKKSEEVDTPSGSTGVYTGSAQSNYSYASGCTVSGDTSKTNVGTYTVTVSLPSDTATTTYVWKGSSSTTPISKTWYITTKYLDKPYLTDGSKTYTACSQSPTEKDFNSTWETRSSSSVTSATNAGTYYYYWDLKDTSNTAWTGGGTGTHSNYWKISTKSLTISSWGTDTFTYNGSAHSLSPSLSGVISGDMVTVICSDNSRTEPGDQTVTATGLDGASKDNYTLSGTLTHTLTISKIAGSITITSSTSPDIKVGATHQITYSMTGDGSISFSVTYGSTYASVSSTGLITGAAKGNATITVTLSEGTYYSGATATVGAKIYIDKHYTDIPTFTNGFSGGVYKGKKYTPTYTPTSISGGSITGNGMSEQINVGTYTITFTLPDNEVGDIYYWTGTTDHNPRDLSWSITVATPDLVFSETAVTKVCYDAAFSHAGTTDFGTITYNSSNTDAATIDSDGLITIGKGGLTTTITASVAADSTNHNWTSTSKAFVLTVNKFTNTWTQTASTEDMTLTFGATGEARAWIATYGGALYVSSDPTSIQLDSQTHAPKSVTSCTYLGTANITVSVAESDYYTGLTTGYKVTVTQKVISVTTPTIDSYGPWTYNGLTEYDITDYINQPIECSRIDASSTLKTIHAGTHHITFKLLDNTTVQKYEWSDGTTERERNDITWSVAKAANPVTLTLSSSVRYNDSITGLASATFYISGYTLSVESTVPDVAAVSIDTTTHLITVTGQNTQGKVLPQGTQIKVTYPATDDTYSGTASVDITVTRANTTKPTWMDAGNHWTFSNSEITSTLRVNVDGNAVTFSGDRTGTHSNNSAAYYLFVMPDNNHMWDDQTTTTVSMDWYIDPATPVFTFASSSLTKTYGDAVFTNAVTVTPDFITSTVTYSSSDTTKATVNASTGEVTIVAADNNTISITAAVDGESTYGDWTAGDGSYSLTINRKSISGCTITLGDALTYTGVEQTQTITSVVIDSLTATYEFSDDEDYTHVGTNAGNYTLKITGTGNFMGDSTKPWTIAKAESPMTWSQPSSYTCHYKQVVQYAPYNADDVTGTALPYAQDACGDITYGSGAHSTEVNYTVDTTMGRQISIASGTAIGSYSIILTATDPGDSNHNGTTLEVVVTVVIAAVTTHMYVHNGTQYVPALAQVKTSSGWKQMHAYVCTGSSGSTYTWKQIL